MLRFWERAVLSGDARRRVEAWGRGRGRTRRRWRPSAEGLEARALLTAVPGVDYTLSGYRWANPAHITYSIAPDGVEWDHGINNLSATFDARFGAGAWERIIARTLATWESVANINIALVADSTLPYDTPGPSQGDPRFGDIRFGGYAFLGDTTTLADTTYPPPNGQTAAGDVQINTAMDFNNGSAYDLFSVLLHETGHALGLAHATNPAEVMYPSYQGVRAGLSPGDIAGIQALYGARTPDAYQQQGQGLGFSGAIDLTSGLGNAQQETISGVSLATIGDTEYFSVVAPDVSGATLRVTAAAGNISMLSPQVTLFDAGGQALDVEGNSAAWSDNVSARVGQVVPGQSYYIAVTGATQDVFAVGAYQLQVAFVGGVSAPTTSPTTPPATSTPPPTSASQTTPPTQTTVVDASPTPASIAPDRFEPNNTLAQATALGTITATTVGNLSLDTSSDVDDFAFRVARAGRYQVTAPGTSIRVLNGAGQLVASGLGSVAFTSPRARTSYDVEIGTADGAAPASYTLTIAPQTTSHAAVARAPVHRQAAPKLRPRHAALRISHA
jgi:hypothetical protein